MTYPEAYHYTKDHEWVVIANNQATVGISEFAQSELGEVVFVELPVMGTKVNKGDSLCVVESTKAASDVYAPVSGTVVAINSVLEENPTLLNESPHDKAWLVKLSDVDESDLATLMDASAYTSLVNG